MSKTYKIAQLGGDGTGPEVVKEGVKVVEAAAKKNNFKIEWIPYDLGGARYLKTGEVLPESVIAEFKKLDAIFLGAIGHPDVKPGILERGILLKLRFELDQYINLRPVKLYPNVETPLKDKGPKDIDFVIVRENTEGLYVGAGGFLRKDTPQEVAIQESINTRFGVERCVRYSFELTKNRNKNNKLTLGGKTNVLTYASDIWQRTFNDVAKEYPMIKGDYVN
ncbi:MAG: isocitrate/isopropylmalate family dehydrogenase, partial [Endomicrobia bacterium]|nr:isocitrate/isopropylmalate family dehydrogenase [Endomicrobiia bacterium]